MEGGGRSRPQPLSLVLKKNLLGSHFFQGDDSSWRLKIDSYFNKIIIFI